MYTASSNWDYEKRRFDPLPAGFRATGADYEASSGKLDVADNVFVRAGLGLVLSGIDSNLIRLYKLPETGVTAATVEGILFFDETNFRYEGLQPKYTHTNKDLVSVIRKGHMRVHKNGAIALNAGVYLIFDSTVANETPGMFKATSGANAIQIKNAKWAEVAGAGVGVATLELLGGGFA